MSEFILSSLNFLKSKREDIEISHLVKNMMKEAKQSYKL